MDVQGSELMVSGGVKVFSAADTVVVEASMRSLYAGGPTFHELYKKMSGLGFEYAGVLNQQFSPNRSMEVIQSDIIYRRRNANC